MKIKKWKTQKRVLSKEKLNVLTMIKKIQPIDSIKPNAHGTDIDLVFKKEQIKCNHIKRLYKKWLTMTMLQKKTLKNII